MTTRRFLWIASLTLIAAGFHAPGATQKADVPEPSFLNFNVGPAYVPVYKGRDPFKSLGTFDKGSVVSIAELEFHGVIKMGNVFLALFSWRGNADVRYTLRFRKLYGADDRRIDGVVGDITDAEVVLVQGDRKIVYPRSQRRP